MPYLLNGKPTITPGRSFQAADGSTVTNEWTKVFNTEELKALGVTWQDDPAWVDKHYYFNADTPRDIDVLKAAKLADQKTTAASLLSKYDWYVTRKTEIGTAVPDAVTTYRAAVRTVCGTREAEINAVSTTPALKSLMEAADKILDTDGKTYIDNPAAHLTPWPTEPS